MNKINIENADVYISGEKLEANDKVEIDYDEPEEAQDIIDNTMVGDMSIGLTFEVDREAIEEVYKETINAMDFSKLVVDLALMYDVSYYEVIQLAKLVKDNAELVEAMAKLEGMSYDELKQYLIMKGER